MSRPALQVAVGVGLTPVLNASVVGCVLMAAAAIGAPSGDFGLVLFASPFALVLSPLSMPIVGLGMAGLLAWARLRVAAATLAVTSLLWAGGCGVAGVLWLQWAMANVRP